MKDKIIRIVLVLVGLGVIGWCIYAGFQVGKNRQATLTIVHVNDTHSHMEPVRSGENAGPLT